MNGFEIDRMITISTAHISKETRRMLNNSLIEDLTYYAKYGFGWFIHIPPMDRLDDSDIPEDLAACLRYALNKYGKASTQQSENHTDRTASE